MRSVSTSRAPRRAMKFAAAAPLLPNPTTIAVTPSSFILPELKRGKRNEGADDGDYPETHDHDRLWPSLEFVMMVQRGHPKDPAMGQLVVVALDDHRDRLDHEDSACDHEGKLLLGEDRDHPERPAERKRSHIAHDHRGRIRVVPEKTERGGDQRGAEDGHFAHSCHVRNLQICRELRVASRVA